MTSIEPARWLESAVRRVTYLGLAVALTITMTAGTGRAQAAPPTDPVDRAMWFVDRCAEATEQMNAGQYDEALAGFRKLATTCGDLDEDGFVAIAIGDCLAALRRDDEARAAYQAARAAHPDQATSIDRKLVELEMAGPVTNDLIDRLRQLVATANDANTRTAFQWQLARALQKRAKALLDESVLALRDGRLPATDVWGQISTKYADLVEELATDLGSLIARTERRWGSARGPAAIQRPADVARTESSGVDVQSIRLECIASGAGNSKVSISVSWGRTDAPMEIVVDGQRIVLNDEDMRQLERYVDRAARVVLKSKDSEERPSPGSKQP